MKKLLALMLIASACMAQDVVNKRISQTTSYFWQTIESKAYANSQKDTSLSYALGGYSRLSLDFVALSAVNVSIMVDTKKRGSSTWTVKDTLAVSGTSGDDLTADWVLRDQTTEVIPGVSDSVRVRYVFAVSGNTTSTYTSRLNYR
jgi:hypothetical protein